MSEDIDGTLLHLATWFLQDSNICLLWYFLSFFCLDFVEWPLVSEGLKDLEVATGILKEDLEVAINL